MECSICLNAITTATGQVTTSCGHHFHFRCLSTWYDARIDNEEEQTCPLCRHVAAEEEGLPLYDGEESVSDDEDEYDDEDDEDDDEEEEHEDEVTDEMIPLEVSWTREENGTWIQRIIFQHPPAPQDPPAPVPVPAPAPQDPPNQTIHAVKKLQAYWRGRQARKDFELARTVLSMSEAQIRGILDDVFRRP